MGDTFTLSDTLMSVKRQWFTDKSTIGRFYIGEDYQCFTLEDTVRQNGIKIYGRTAIPEGQYEVIVNYSNRFKRPLPLLLDVPDFDGIRIHPGNTEEDTLGCILVGNIKGDNAIFDSRNAFTPLYLKIVNAISNGKLFLSIINLRAEVENA